MKSIVACCHSAKHCAYAALDFRSQHYPCVVDAADYEDEVRILKSLYVKTKNTVYARHLLVSRHQLQGETLPEYLQVLKSLAKDCTFSEVTAATYRQELNRDVFINGLSSASIRQTSRESRDNFGASFRFS